MWIAVTAMALGSLLVTVAGRRAAHGTLPRNHLVGIRVAATMRDDRAWYVAHRAAGPTLVATGLLGIALAGFAAVVGAGAGDRAAAWIILAAAVLLVGGVLLAARRAVHAVR